jgi:DNA polymerase/3'-5' exonuclease PolX
MADDVDFKRLIVEALGIMRTTVLSDPSPDAKKTARFVAAAYSKVIKAIEALPAVRSYDDVKDVPGIGKEIKANIKEILETKALKAAERALAERPIALLEELQSIHDVGPAKANALVAAGVTSIADLREKVKADPKLLTKSQTVGLRYFEDIRKRIPRAEMAEHERILTAAIDPSFKATIVGSYRRGAMDSGDIDLLLMLAADTPKAEQVAKFHAAAAKLRADGYLVETLSEGDDTLTFSAPRAIAAAINCA